MQGGEEEGNGDATRRRENRGYVWKTSSGSSSKNAHLALDRSLSSSGVVIRKHGVVEVW